MFDTSCKCDLLLNNLCESWNGNKDVMKARELPILQMLETIRRNLIVRIQTNKKVMEKSTKHICPKIQEVLEEKAQTQPSSVHQSSTRSTTRRLRATVRTMGFNVNEDRVGERIVQPFSPTSVDKEYRGGVGIGYSGSMPVHVNFGRVHPSCPPRANGQQGYQRAIDLGPATQ